ncbi:unnamed protein product [Lepeophtheirus salmonis]|uniref:(salmon louse) hypothetical protein n=2 Tax=Lepeophtheirus salmonis TaxID=72036 RepID=A0A7R8D2T9_LEPSM|nr:uncharacterized protein LOC121121724 [Lepeophtheirus salmonis]CAB4068492.1 unnamed protein product [Lepeophtheirus salmonis]CAF3008833.1 unnamed protein product [Lepeophtheirus salmonis]
MSTAIELLEFLEENVSALTSAESMDLQSLVSEGNIFQEMQLLDELFENVEYSEYSRTLAPGLQTEHLRSSTHYDMNLPELFLDNGEELESNWYKRVYIRKYIIDPFEDNIKWAHVSHGTL